MSVKITGVLVKNMKGKPSGIRTIYAFHMTLIYSTLLYI